MNKLPVNYKPFLLTSFALGGLLLSDASQAQTCEKMPGVNLSAQAMQEVENNMVQMNWQVKFERNSAGKAMRDTSEVLNDALATLKRNQNIRNLRSNVETYPRYGKDQLLTGWMSTGQLSFEMPLPALEKNSDLSLPDNVVLTGIQYFTSPDVVEKTRAKLIKQAIGEFQGKASEVAKGFGHSAYTLGDININDQGGGGPRPVFATRAFASEAPMAKMNVPVSGGTSQIAVSVNGQVCLKP